MSFSLILYIHRFCLSGSAPLSLSAELIPCFLQFTAVGIPSIDAMTFYRRQWSSSCVSSFCVLSTSTCTTVSFFNVFKYLSYVVFNVSLYLWFFFKNCSLSSFTALRRFSIWLIFDLNQSILTFQLSIPAVASQNCLISRFRLLDLFVSCQIFVFGLELVFSRSKVYNFPDSLFSIASKCDLALIGVFSVLSASLSSNEIMACNRMTLSSAIGGLSFCFYFQVFRFSGFCFSVLDFSFSVFSFWFFREFPISSFNFKCFLMLVMYEGVNCYMWLSTNY